MTSNFVGLYNVRDYQEGDKAFVLATFLRGVYYGDFFFNVMPKDVFMQEYKRVAELLVLSPHVTIKVACLKEDPDVIIGYSILSADFSTIHWVYVKAGDKKNNLTWRNKGIARSLLPQYPQYITHLSKLGLSLMHKFPTAIFNPFKL